MFYRHKIDSLTDDELCIVLYGLNTYRKPLTTLEVTETILCAYKKNNLFSILNNDIKPKLNEAGLALLESINKKLWPN